MNNTRQLIFKRLEELQKSAPSINRFFIFSLEDLQDDPEFCFNQIEKYINKHSNKIRDFEFESWIDEETFCPVVMLKMYPSEELATNLHRSNILNSLVPSSVEAEILRERIQNVLAKYKWQFNEPEVRKSIIDELAFALSLDGIIDKTTNENVDKQILNFVIKEGDKEITIHEYLENIKNKKRYE